MGFASSMGLGALGMTPAWQWGRPKTLLKQSTDGIPKVIANKPIALSNGDWVMPFWREQPNEANNGTCTQKGKEGKGGKEGREGREGGEGRGEGRGEGWGEGGRGGEGGGHASQDQRTDATVQSIPLPSS